MDKNICNYNEDLNIVFFKRRSEVYMEVSSLIDTIAHYHIHKKDHILVHEKDILNPKM